MPIVIQTSHSILLWEGHDGGGPSGDTEWCVQYALVGHSPSLSAVCFLFAVCDVLQSLPHAPGIISGVIAAVVLDTSSFSLYCLFLACLIDLRRSYLAFF